MMDKAAIFILVLYAQISQQEISSTSGSLIHMMVQYGPFAVLVVMFIMWDWKRENRIANRVTTLEDFIKEDLMSQNKVSTSVITAYNERSKKEEQILREHTVSIKENTEAIRELISEMKNRPCLLEKKDREEV